MYTLLARHGTAADSPEGSVVRACFMKAISGAAKEGSSVYNGYLGVLRHEHPNLDRQRRYDFWLKRA